MQKPFSWLDPLRIGLIGGAVIILVSLIGMIGRFSERPIVEGVVSLGRTLYLGILFITAYRAADRAAKMGRPRAEWLAASALAGTAALLLVSLFLLLGQSVNLRTMFINATPALYTELALGLGVAPAALAGLVGIGAGIGLLAGAVHLLPGALRHALTIAVITVILLGLLGELILLSNLSFRNSFRGWLLASKGLSTTGAIIALLAVTLFNLLWQRQGPALSRGVNRLPRRQQNTLKIVLFALLLLLLINLPELMGPYYSEVLNQVGIFILLGLGLNIVVGFAGMLDLGYVAFFALGAYTMGVLTSPEKAGAINVAGQAVGGLSFWQALPFAVLIALGAGFMLGVPVLRMRGDYLAIVTLGFGEIIQRLAVSDWLKPIMGGAQGISRIATITLPQIPAILPAGLSVSGPQKPQLLFFWILAACLLVAFIASRLKKSRLGRAWMAIREDEDVAQAMGINLVATKLLAFGTGAAMSGMGGVLFSTKLGSIYPNSFGLLISINILALIIVGGMGSIPGVILGALVLVGLPELLREFVDFRLLVYGAVLVFMMLKRPEGLLPDAAHKRELNEEYEDSTYEGDVPHAEPMIATR